MKRSGLVCLMLVNVLSVGALAGEWEVGAALDNFFPSDDLWDSYAIGGEVKAVYWTTPQWGIAVAGGWTKWDVADDTAALSEDVTLSWCGDVTYIPVGVSLLARLGTADRGKLTGIVEAGVRYMFCDSSIEATRTTAIPDSPPDVEVFDVDGDDGIVARIGGGLEWALGSSPQPAKLLLTGGYQFDLDKGQATESWLGIDEDLKLAAFYVEIGLVIPIQ